MGISFNFKQDRTLGRFLFCSRSTSFIWLCIMATSKFLYPSWWNHLKKCLLEFYFIGWLFICLKVTYYFARPMKSWIWMMQELSLKIPVRWVSFQNLQMHIAWWPLEDQRTFTGLFGKPSIWQLMCTVMKIIFLYLLNIIFGRNWNRFRDIVS